MTHKSEPIRVLLVDDHPLTCWGLSSLIEGEAPGMQLAGTAANAQAALRLAARIQPDVILLDILLGDCCGFDLMPQMQHACGARIIILSCHADADLRRRAAALGAWDYVGKDEPAAVLLDAIRDSA